MNKDQINNGEIRIFPFFRGEYMGELPFGYSNEKSARKFMKGIPAEYVYEKFGGEEEYRMTHECLSVLNKSELLVFNGWGTLSERKTDGIYDYKYNGDVVYMKDMDPGMCEEIRKDVSEIGWVYDCKDRELVRRFEEKYDLFPNIRVDMDDFEKEKKRIVKEEVVFRKGILHIDVEYIDG